MSFIFYRTDHAGQMPGGIHPGGTAGREGEVLLLSLPGTPGTYLVVPFYRQNRFGGRPVLFISVWSTIGLVRYFYVPVRIVSYPPSYLRKFLLDDFIMFFRST